MIMVGIMYPIVANRDQLTVDVDDSQKTLEATAELAHPAEEKPYSIYTKREKWAIVVMSSVAGIFR